MRHHLPIQKCIAGGSVQDLSDPELLAIILGTGTRTVDVLELASFMVKQFGGLQGIHGSGLREMAQKHGVGMKKAVRIHAAFELGRRLLSAQNSSPVIDSPERVWKLLQPEMAALKREEFRVFILNNKNSILKKSTVSVGTVSEALIHPREIRADGIDQVHLNSDGLHSVERQRKQDRTRFARQANARQRLGRRDIGITRSSKVL